MEDLHAALRELQLALQSLLKKYNSLKREFEHLKSINDELSSELAEKEKLIKAAEERIVTNNLSSLYGPEDKQLLQSKIDTYLKDIEKCLTILNAR